MSGTAFLGSFLKDYAGLTLGKQQQDQQDEMNRKQMTIEVLSRAAQDPNLTPEGHDHAMRMILDTAGLPKKDIEQIANTALPIKQWIDSQMGQTSQQPSPIQPNRLTLDPDTKWVEPPDIQDQDQTASHSSRHRKLHARACASPHRSQSSCICLALATPSPKL